jgi:hypothetical protein
VRETLEGAKKGLRPLSALLARACCWAKAIALFYAVGTGIAALSPTLFGALIATKSATNVNYGYLLGVALMIGAGIVAWFLAVDAERRSLEDIARPFTAVKRRMATAIPARAR